MMRGRVDASRVMTRHDSSIDPRLAHDDENARRAGDVRAGMGSTVVVVVSSRNLRGTRRGWWRDGGGEDAMGGGEGGGGRERTRGVNDSTRRGVFDDFE